PVRAEVGEEFMRRWSIPIIAALLLLSGQTVLAAQPTQGVVRDLADANNARCHNPEGITASPNGLLYAAGLSGNICIYDLSGNEPFGANGVAFDRTQSFLYVANTADDRILRIAVNKDGSAGAISIFADGATLGPGALDGADGIQFDVKGNLYVCANQANEIQVLSPSGALIARYGHNAGDDPLDFPASPIFHERGLYIANLALGTPPNGGK